MKKLNLPNKITLARIFLSFLIIMLFVLPWNEMGIEWPIYVYRNIIIDLKYIIGGILFVIAASSDFVDGYIARKHNLVTEFGKVADAIADKILVNGLLIILAFERNIPVIVPVVIITRDTITDSIKMIVGNKGKAVGASILGKIKTAFMMVGLTLTLFYNLPFEIWSINVSEILIIIATVLSVVSGVEYYALSKDIIFKDS